MASHILAGELPAPHANEPVMSRLIPRVRSGILRANRTDVNATTLAGGHRRPQGWTMESRQKYVITVW